MARCVRVTLAEILLLRDRGLTPTEFWAVLAQSVQTLQSFFLAGDGCNEAVVPILTTSDVQFSCRGRVVLTTNKTLHVNTAYIAPEYLDNTSVLAHHGCWEKMWVFTLGMCLQDTIASEMEPQGKLHKVLKGMTDANPTTRLTLLDLLKAITVEGDDQQKPFSHIIIDLYKEVLGSVPQCLSSPENNGKREKQLVSQSAQLSRLPLQPRSLQLAVTPKTTVPKTLPFNKRNENVGQGRKPVQRAASRLYRGPTPRDIDSAPSPLVGPEFIVRSERDPLLVRVGDPSASATKNHRTLIVLLLSGQRLQLSVDPKISTTQVFQVVTQVEQVVDNYLLGLCALIGGDFVFLPDNIKLHKAAPVGWRDGSTPQWLIYVRFRYFLPSLRGLRRPQTKHLLYLQLRRSILDRQLLCSECDLRSLCGLALQAEFGDYCEEKHGTEYFLPEHYIPETAASIERLEAIQLEHADRHGLDSSSAEHLFISIAQRLPNYGQHFHSAVWCRSGSEIPLMVAVCLDGVCLYAWADGERKLHERFSWKAIQRLTYDKNHFCIVPHNVGGLELTRYKLRLELNKSFYLFRLASFHHQVFVKLHLELCSMKWLSQNLGVPLQDENVNFIIENKVNSIIERREYDKEHPNRNRAGVKMGMNAFRPCPAARTSSVSSRDAYVIEERSRAFSVDLHESLPESLADKLADLSCQEERFLKKVTLLKDRYGSIGIEVAEDLSGHVFVVNVLRCDGDLVKVRNGDEVLSINEVCVVGRGYSTALSALRSSDEAVHVVLAQSVTPALCTPLDVGHEYLRNIRYEMAAEADTYTELPATKLSFRYDDKLKLRR